MEGREIKKTYVNYFSLTNIPSLFHTHRVWGTSSPRLRDTQWNVGGTLWKTVLQAGGIRTAATSPQQDEEEYVENVEGEMLVCLILNAAGSGCTPIWTVFMYMYRMCVCEEDVILEVPLSQSL